ncbi:class I SAM-dependent methyltransferase [Roseovarius aestuariivivens]|uniref:class I SAM-dependent methyltransferase n=1 Tax=Roseovarius aestuariivivens TaxID=1888910 RepID=UPI001081DD5C|nr:class I SAM-dependent methyltransferase [Roseovarius aestuariivivens]
MPPKDKSAYSRTWDAYVTKSFPRIKAGPPHQAENLQPWQVLNTTDAEYTWPGDEWGDARAVAQILDTCVAPYLGAAPQAICEIASGGGRFTQALLDRYPDTRLHCFDISQAFLDQMQRRFADEIALGRVRTHRLTDRPALMFKTLEKAGLRRTLDAVVSFDAMVHVELHSVLIYVATAAATLKPGGLLAMNVADGANPRAFEKLLCNAPGAFRLGGQAGPHFQFMSREIVDTMLSRMGFVYDLHDCNGRDLFFSARLDDPEAAPRAFKDAGSNWLPAA